MSIRRGPDRVAADRSASLAVPGGGGFTGGQSRFFKFTPARTTQSEIGHSFRNLKLDIHQVDDIG